MTELFDCYALLFGISFGCAVGFRAFFKIKVSKTHADKEDSRCFYQAACASL